MPTCEICGKKKRILNWTEIEGTKMSVCDECSELGTVIKKVKPEKEKSESKKRQESKKAEKKEEPKRAVVSDYSKKIRRLRREKDLSQEELSDEINEKLSVVKKMENGKMRPSFDLAEKIEDNFNINLIEKVEVKKKSSGKKSKSGKATIGDVVEIKKK